MAYTMVLGLPDLPTLYNLSAGVGYARANLRDDVMLVQVLLKMADAPVFSGGVPVGGTGMITVDGYFGPETNSYIGFFERELEERHMVFQKGNNLDPASSDGFTKQGVQYLIVHLNRMAKQRLTSEYDWLPFNDDTPPLLRRSLARGAKEPKPVFMP